MTMESLFTFLSHLVLFLSLTTLLFACGAYAALVLRRRRRPVAARRVDPTEVVLVRRYMGERHG